MSEHLSTLLAEFVSLEKVVENALLKNKSKFSSLPINHKIFHPTDLDTCFQESATPEQYDAFQALKNNPEKTVAILGPGGTGKSQFIHWIAEKYRNSGRVVQITATTGYAAYQLNGITFYKFFSLFPNWFKYATKLECAPKMLNEQQFLRLVQTYHTKFKDAALRIIETDLLVIDEISMLDGPTLLVMDMIARYLRQSPLKPFGGLQVLLSGDFLQLPPVTATLTESAPRFIFQYPAWNDIWKPIIVNFTTNVRSQDPAWSSILSRMRLGKCTEQDVEKLKQRRVGELARNPRAERLPPKAVLTHLFPHLKKVDDFNTKERNKLKTNDHYFKTVIKMQANVKETVNQNFYFLSGKHHADDYQETFRDITIGDPAYEMYFSITNKCSPNSRHEKFPFLAENDEHSVNVLNSFFEEYKFPFRSQFRVGEKVMLRDNLLQENGLVNGSTGTVIGFLNNNSEFLEKAKYTIDDLRVSPESWSETGTGFTIVRWSHGDETIVPYSTRKIPLLKTRVVEEEEQNKTISQGTIFPVVGKKRPRPEQKKISWYFSIQYIPLQSAAAITSHKCQGLTLPFVYVGTPQYCFDYGMFYVMCSRVRKLEHLFLDDSFEDVHIRAHPEAVSFSEK